VKQRVDGFRYRRFSWTEILQARPTARCAALCCGLLAGIALWSSAVHAFPLIVQPGDTLAGIAQKIYGKVEYERLLVSANGLDIEGGVPITPGMRLEVPAVAHRRTAQGDTWPALAASLLGAPHRSGVLAFANDSKPWLLPIDNAEIVIPYNLRFIARGGEALDDLAERFLGSEKRTWMLYQYNELKTPRLERGQLLLIPLTELPLTEAGRLAARQSAEGLGELGGERRAAQRAVAEELPALLAEMRAGKYSEAVARGVTLLGGPALTTPQRASIERQLLEAYAALGATQRAARACQNWLRAAPRARLDPSELSPKLLAACRMPAAAAAGSK
jgi:hypothetical protein